MIMGAADIVPGVSGGTMALILGIYEKFIDSLRSFNITLFKTLKKNGIRAAWQHVNGSFLLPLLGGILISVATLARIITWLLENYPPLIWAFFFGLVLASSIIVLRKVGSWNVTKVIIFIVGGVVAYYITIMTPTTTPNTWWFILLAGSIAITAMLLPGISGSFILVLLGKYHFILSAVKDMDITILSLFAFGCGLGLILSSRVIHWVLHRFHDYALAGIVGFMIGSLNKVWPWKQTETWYQGSHGQLEPLIQYSVLPWQYTNFTAQPSYIFGSIILFAIGLGFIIMIYKIGKKRGA